VWRDGKPSDDYMIGDILGVGATGKVYLGTHLASGDKRALKVIDVTYMVDSEKEQLLTEMKILSTVRHCGCSSMTAAYQYTSDGSDGGGGGGGGTGLVHTFVCIVQELATGGEVMDRLSKKQYTEQDVRALARQVGDAIRHLHSVGIVHRDLKPENVMYVPACCPASFSFLSVLELQRSGGELPLASSTFSSSFRARAVNRSNFRSCEL
jgi:serine/threonine protein kinase